MEGNFGTFTIYIVFSFVSLNILEGLYQGKG